MASEKKHRSLSSDSVPDVVHQDQTGSPSVNPPAENELSVRQNAVAKAENPLAGKSKEELSRMAEEYCEQYGFTAEEDIRVFRLGALVAGNDFQWDSVPGLSEAEVAGLEFERDHKYKSLPKTLVGVVVVCVSIYTPWIISHSVLLQRPYTPPLDQQLQILTTHTVQALCAAVQGADETVVNGAQHFYATAFGIGSSSGRDSWLLGLVNSAPYLCCAFIGCWLTEPLNARFGRRGTVFIACVISALACFWQGFTSKRNRSFVRMS